MTFSLEKPEGAYPSAEFKLKLKSKGWIANDHFYFFLLLMAICISVQSSPVDDISRISAQCLNSVPSARI